MTTSLLASAGANSKSHPPPELQGWGMPLMWLLHVQQLPPAILLILLCSRCWSQECCMHLAASGLHSRESYITQQFNHTSLCMATRRLWSHSCPGVSIFLPILTLFLLFFQPTTIFWFPLLCLWGSRIPWANNRAVFSLQFFYASWQCPRVGPKSWGQPGPQDLLIVFLT